MHPTITLEDTQLPLEHSPKILGVIMDSSFHKHFNYVIDRIDKRNNMLKALVGSPCGQAILHQSGATMQVTRDLRRYRQRKCGSEDGHHRGSPSSPGVLTLKVRDHSDMLSAQYHVNCLEEDHVYHGRLSTLYITQLFFLNSGQARKIACTQTW